LRSDSSASLEESLIYYPTDIGEQLVETDGEFEDAWFAAADGTSLHGWFAAAEKPRAVVLYCHGNAGNIASRRPILELYRDRLGASILVFDYRGYGRSEGKPNEEGILQDARAARKWLAEKTGIHEREIVVVGNSLGGGVAVDLAATDGARGLVLENTFTSMPDVAAAHFRWLPVRWMMQTQFNSASKIGNYHGPLLQTHGDADEVVPYALGKKLFDAANEPKEFVFIPGGRHTEWPAATYLKSLDQFLGTLPASGQPPLRLAVDSP
jgi:fermentation-respiration switch protein FrsA (DUF1100 family)